MTEEGSTVVGLYQDHFLPWLLHKAMQNKEAARERAALLPAASGRVLELGMGSGLNLPFYGSGVTSITGIDPSKKLLSMAQAYAREANFPVHLMQGSAETLPFDDHEFDCVVTTWTLCSIPDAGAALREARRVLRPGGSLLFAEHGASPEAKILAWQDRLNSIWGRVAGGCNINRPIDRLIEGAGFRMGRFESGYFISGPRILTYIYRGCAQPR